MHLSGQAMDAANFLKLTLPDVESIFAIPGMRETPSPIAAVSVMAPSPLRVCAREEWCTREETKRVAMHFPVYKLIISARIRLYLCP